MDNTKVEEELTNASVGARVVINALLIRGTHPELEPLVSIMKKGRVRELTGLTSVSGGVDLARILEA